MRQLHIIIYIAALFFCIRPATLRADGNPFVVVLDAGHGGKDPGTIGSVASHREKDVVLNITKEVGRLLKNNHPNDIKIIYTRQTDVFVELGRRAEIANKAKADLFISIHVNALPKKARRKAIGVQSYTLSLAKAETNLEVEKLENSVIALEGEAAKKYNYNASAESNIMFELMQDYDMKKSVEFAKLAQKEMTHTGGRKDMGVHQANLAVLRLTYMPSVLLEVGYMSTPAEEQYLTSANGQSTLARCIYRAITQYKEKNTGTSPKQRQAEPTVPAQAATPPVSPPAAPKTDSMPPQPTPETAAPTPSPAPEKAAPKSESQPPYRVQILAGSVKLKPNDRQFKGLKVERHQFGNTYKYTYGAVETLEEAKKLKNSILDKFPQAFVVHF